MSCRGHAGKFEEDDGGVPYENGYCGPAVVGGTVVKSPSIRRIFSSKGMIHMVHFENPRGKGSRVKKYVNFFATITNIAVIPGDYPLHEHGGLKNIG